MSIQWPAYGGEIITRNGTRCSYRGVCEITKLHKVYDPKAGQNGTVWLLDDNGICRCDGVAGEHDFAKGA